MKKDDFPTMVSPNTNNSYKAQEHFQKWRLFVVFVTLMIGVGINAIPSMSYRYVECVDDTIHDLLQHANSWLQAHSDEKNMMLSVLSVVSDLVFVVMVLDWAVNQKSWRLAIALVLLILTKEVSSVSYSN